MERDKTQTTTALVFMGGTGSGPETGEDAFSVSSRTIGGLTLFERVALSCRKAGVRRLLVAGPESARTEQARGGRYDGLNIKFFPLTDRDTSSHEIIKALKDALQEETNFFLISGHWVFESKLLEELDLNRGLMEGRLAMAAEKKDAAREARPHFPGIFLCAGGLAESFDNSTGSPLDILKSEDEAGRLLRYGISGLFLEYVGTKEGLRAAQMGIYKTLTKETDGFLATRVNRKISISITKLLVHTRLTPNQMTLINLGIGLIGALFFALGGYGPALAGSLIFQISSITDGCDGEIARLKFMESRFGGWLDIICDNLTHIAVFGGIAYGEYRADPSPYFIYLGLSAVFGAFMSFLVVACRLYEKKTGGGPFFTSVMENKEGAGSGAKAIADLQDTLARRDFTYLLIVFAIFGQVKYFLVLIAVGSNIFWILLIFARSRLVALRMILC